MLEVIFSQISRWAIPFFVLLIVGVGFIRGVKVFEVFAEGAQEGFWLAVKLIPYIVGLFVAIGLFRDSGVLDLCIGILQPFLSLVGVPGEVVPLFMVRPLSGMAAMAMTVELFHRLGPDSFAGRLASTIHGSTDTTLYILSVYFASVGIKRFRYALTVGLIGDVAGFVASVFIVNRMFGS